MAMNPTMEEIIKNAENNIRQAVIDYGKHTRKMDVLNDFSDAFITRLARDSSYAKQGLRNLFSKSPVWHPELDAIIINGTRTHDPDRQRIRDLARQILREPLNTDNDYQRGMLLDAIDFFGFPDSTVAQERGIEAINELAPKAYRPGKKRSRVFKALCVALGVANETAGSEFQHLYAQFADELNSREIGFKLFVSINPAHFLTMSNPKSDRRGSCLTSCHSLNSTEYSYNCGCSGYARDEVSFIVFTVDDPSDAETLNNRKTTRQVFAYKPGNGILLQSRMYNTAGGASGQVEESKLYRDLIQREISALEGKPNLWNTFSSYGTTGREWVTEDGDFGGYPDWEYDDFGGKICIRTDCPANCEPLTIGEAGLCVCCGEEITENMYCDSCDPDRFYCCCDECGGGIENGDGAYLVYDESGNQLTVCEDCLNSHYTYCNLCGTYHQNDVMTCVENGEWVCNDCLDRYYTKCGDCGKYFRTREAICVTGEDGEAVLVCRACNEYNYVNCPICGDRVHINLLRDCTTADGDEIAVCKSCYEFYGYDENETNNDLMEAV